MNKFYFSQKCRRFRKIFSPIRFVNEIFNMDDKNTLDCTEENAGKKLLRSWLNKNMKIQMTDGRTLIGIFLCTDSDKNVILGSCEEYLKPPDHTGKKEEPRILGLAMIPGHHIVSIHVDAERHSPQTVT